METIVEAQSILRAVLPFPFEKKYAWIKRAGTFFGLTFSQAKKLEYGELKDLRASRLDAMRIRYADLKETSAQRGKLHDELKLRVNELRATHGGREAGNHRDVSPPAIRRGAGDASGGDSESGGDAATFPHS